MFTYSKNIPRKSKTFPWALLLEPVDNNNTRVTWTQYTNPGGNLPTWLINSVVKEVPFRTLQGLRKKVFNSKYQQAKIIVNSQGNIVNLITAK